MRMMRKETFVGSVGIPEMLIILFGILVHVVVASSLFIKNASFSGSIIATLDNAR